MQNIANSLFVVLDQENKLLKETLQTIRRAVNYDDLETIKNILNNDKVQEIVFSKKDVRELIGGTKGNKSLSQMSIEELKELCRRRGIINYSNLSKKELKKKCSTFRIPNFQESDIKFPAGFNDFFNFVSNQDVINTMMLFMSKRYSNDCVIIGEGETEGIVYLVDKVENVENEEEDFIVEDEEEEPEEKGSILKNLFALLEQKEKDEQEKKEKEDVVILGDLLEEEESEGIDLAKLGEVKIIQTLEIPEDVEEKLYECEESGKRFIIINLHLNNNIENHAHSNILILDTEQKIMERFETYGKIPNMSLFEGPMFDEDDIDERIKRIIADPLEYTYIKPLDFCPIRSFQEIQETDEHGLQNMCQAWTIWYADMRLRYPDMDRQKLVDKLLKIKDKKGGLNQHIKGFIQFFIDVYINIDNDEEMKSLLKKYTRI